MRGAQATFEGADGFLRVYLRDRCDRDVLRNGLGEHYEFTQLSYKPYPCCRFNHAAIDAALALRTSVGVGAAQVRRVRVGVNRQAYEAVATPIDVRKAPHTIVHAQFSLPFTVATALIDGRVELGHFTERSIRREDILALAQRVECSWTRTSSANGDATSHRPTSRSRWTTGRRIACAWTGRSAIPAGRCRRRTSTRKPSTAFAHRPSRCARTRPADCAILSTRSSRARTFVRSWASFRSRPDIPPFSHLRRRNDVLEHSDTLDRAVRRRARPVCRARDRARGVAGPPDQADRAVRPGGSNDILARVLAEKLGARLGQPVIVENKGGAGGTIGTDFVAKSPPDGNTILFVSTSITTNAASGKKLPYDAEGSAPIGEVAAGPFAVVVSNDLKATTLKEFIDLARAKPNSINYGSAGIGGINHLGTELFAPAAKIQLVHVPYKGIGPAFTDLMGGNLQMLLPSLAVGGAADQAGQDARPRRDGRAALAACARSCRRRPKPALPDFKLEVWWGIVGPAKLPPPVLKRLNDELNAVLALPDVQGAARARRRGAAAGHAARGFGS